MVFVDQSQRYFLRQRNGVSLPAEVALHHQINKRYAN